MAVVVRLSELDRYPNEYLAQALDGAPKVSDMREAVTVVIRDLHGLPDTMDCQLSQLEVYLGRAAAMPSRLRQRWRNQFGKFKEWRSTHAIVSVRALTAHIRDKGWEKAAQRLIKLLERRRALCCANALVGSQGRWPDSDETAIYIVARKRKGPAGYGVSYAEIKEAVVDLIQEPDLKDDEMVREAAKLLLHPEKKSEHQPLETMAKHDTRGGSENDGRMCKVCDRPARPGNYGYCGYHRKNDGAATGHDVRQCKECDYPAIPGNYGFCGYHRR